MSNTDPDYWMARILDGMVAEDTDLRERVTALETAYAAALARITGLSWAADDARRRLQAIEAALGIVAPTDDPSPLPGDACQRCGRPLTGTNLGPMCFRCPPDTDAALSPSASSAGDA